MGILRDGLDSGTTNRDRHRDVKERRGRGLAAKKGEAEQQDQKDGANYAKGPQGKGRCDDVRGECAKHIDRRKKASGAGPR